MDWEKKKRRAARRNEKTVGVLLQIKMRSTARQQRRSSRRQKVFFQTPRTLYNTKFRFVKFDRAFFEKYFYANCNSNLQ